MNLVDGYWIEMVPSLAPPSHRYHKFRLLEHFEMLHDCTPVNVWKVSAKSARRERLIAKVIEDLPPHGCRQRFEDSVVHPFD
jgi:hypothetical protein